ncbi:MAG TPA: hypothetical protein VHL98_15085 [Microvirga sp.]|jgi:hypothetical protein|nr:hypothetical protein [Microvirga sp.]
MRRSLPGFALALVAGCLAGPGGAGAETLSERVAREEGVAFGPCVLSPKPALPGNAVHAVVPARFENPGIWTTRSLLLVGVDAAGTVQGERELKLAKPIPPREVISVLCRGDRVTIRTTAGTSQHRWTGEALTARKRKQP